MSKYFHRSLRKKCKGGSFFTKPLQNGDNPMHPVALSPPPQQLPQQLPQQPPQQPPQQLPQQPQSPPLFSSPTAKTNVQPKTWFSWFFGDKVTNPFKSTVSTNVNEAKLEDHPRNAGGKQSKRKTHRKKIKKNKSYKRKTKG